MCISFHNSLDDEEYSKLQTYILACTQSYYRTRAIISRDLYIFYPISKDHFFVFKEVFSENSVLMYGLYSRAAYDGAHTVDKKHTLNVGSIVCSSG